MASSSGNSSAATTTTSNQILSNSSSGEDLQHLMEERKRKRMQSNRESARRSRMRKQKHLDDLMSQVADLRKENTQILNSMSVTTQHFMNVEAENAVLRAQMSELSHRLESLNEILNYMNNASSSAAGVAGAGNLYGGGEIGVEMAGVDVMMGNHWNLVHMNQPIMATVDYQDFGY